MFGSGSPTSTEIIYFGQFYMTRRIRSVSLDDERCCRTVMHHIKVLSIVNELLASGKVATKREIYYQNEGIFRNQKELDKAVDRVARTLQVPRDALGIVAGSKGLVYGESLRLEGESREFYGVRLIPMSPKIIYIDACPCVLVVEKESVFQTIVSDYEYLHDQLGKFVVVTGKGYPCMATRKLVSQLGLVCPVFVLVDFDPYGLEIALQYRKGSSVLPDDAGALACPNIRYLGITFKDLDSYGHVDSYKERLTDADRKRAQSIHDQYNSMGWDDVSQSLTKMLDKNMKAEIEAISNDSHFFTRSFLLEKLSSLM